MKQLEQERGKEVRHRRKRRRGLARRMRALVGLFLFFFTLPWRAVSDWRRRRKRRRSGRRLLPAWATMLVWMPVAVLASAGRGLSDVRRRWWRSASFWHLVRGMPALIVALSVLALALLIHIQPTHSLAIHYSTAAQRALAADDLEASRVYYDRLVQLDGGRQESMFRLASVLDQLDEQERVELLLDELAPHDRGGYADAHVWRAQRMLRVGTLDTDQIALVERHLLQAVAEHSERVDAHVLLGQIYFGLQRYEEALPHLRYAVEHQPELRLMLAKTEALTGDSARAQRGVQQALEYYQGRMQKDPRDIDARLGWAEAAMMIGRYEGAVEVLQRRAQGGDQERLRVPLGRVYVAWADSLSASEPKKVHPQDKGLADDPVFQRQIQLLEAALKANPGEMLVFDRLMRILRGEDARADAARETLTALLARGQSIALVHLLLGTDAGERHDREKAIYHLTRAYQLDPDMAVAANNLAWHLAHQDPPDLEQAFVLADLLAERWPEVAHYRDTRGQILAMQGRWSEAVEDLEAALAKLRDNRQLHVTLARAYRELGMLSLASEHQKIAQQLEEG